MTDRQLRDRLAVVNRRRQTEEVGRELDADVDEALGRPVHRGVPDSPPEGTVADPHPSWRPGLPAGRRGKKVVRR